MKQPYEELTPNILNRQTHPLLRNYWTFVHKNLRNRSVWNEFFLQHADEYYPEKVANNSCRTNFPRDIWKRSALTWSVYYEGLVVLSRIYDDMYVSFKIVNKKGEIYRYDIPVEYWRIHDGKLGVAIKHKGRAGTQLVIATDLDRRHEGSLTFILREIMKREKITRVTLENAILAYAKEPDNICTFGSKDIQNIKSSITTSMFKKACQWDMFVRGLRVLGCSAMSIEVVATMSGYGPFTAITHVSMEG